MKLAITDISIFQTIIWSFYRDHGRVFPWRNIEDPYKVLISEVMLQQTQTLRVEQKYEQFITELPNFEALATVALRDLFSLWQGLGYNRRAYYLQQTAKKVLEEYSGVLPAVPELLISFPGIGKATAASVCAFAFNKPTVFIETNIRTVFIHLFFKDQKKIDDKVIMPLIKSTVDQTNPREWYYALMDYGVMLKRQYPNPSRRSQHYTKQSKFDGSDRQIRGKIIRILTTTKKLSSDQLFNMLDKDRDRVNKIIDQLLEEKLIKKERDDFFL